MKPVLPRAALEQDEKTMTSSINAARDDLAFMRSLVEGEGDWRVTFGEAYFAAGLIYGAQMLLHAAEFFGPLPRSGLWAFVIGLGPSLIFAAVFSWILWRHRTIRPNATGRALGAVFGSVGLANLALVAVIGSVAWRERSGTTWLIYPCAVMVLQGAAWMVSYVIRRRSWLALVAAGWIGSGVAMALCVNAMGYFILIAGLCFCLCMALPGWIMVRLSRKAV
jgi:hypothetical protein